MCGCAVALTYWQLVRAMATSRTIQAEPRPDRGRRQEAVRVAAAERQGGARVVALQRARCSSPDEQRRSVGVQQGAHRMRMTLIGRVDSW